MRNFASLNSAYNLYRYVENETKAGRRKGRIYARIFLNLLNSQYLSLPTSDDALAEVTDFDERFDLLWETVKDDHSLLTKRDQRYLQWRYVQNPSEQYRILTYLVQGTLLGYAVFKQYRDEIQIVDILTVKDVKVGVRLISGIVEIARRESAVAVNLWLNISHPLCPH